MKNWCSALVSFGGVVAVLLCMTATVAEASRPYEEAERPLRRWRLLRPAQDNPESQLEHAQDLRAQGRLRRAQRQFRALTRYWPNSDEAPLAQLGYARTLSERGRATRAFEAYEKLLEEYAGLFPHTQVLDQMYTLAEEVMERRRARFLFFPGFHAPERALPLFERIAEFGPRWERTPKAKLLIAQIKEENNKLEEAVFAYDRVQARYPRTPFAEEAAFGKGRALYTLAQRYPRDVDGIETAAYTLAFFVQSFPDSPEADTAVEYVRTLQNQLAKIAYEKARYYDRTARQPAAAIITYERFLERFPESEWSDRARRRLEKLRQKVDPADA